MDNKEKEVWAKEWDRIKNRSASDLSHSRQLSFICQHFEFNVFLDCGPGEAFSEAWRIRQALPTCSILGFEPQPDRFKCLRENFYPGRLFNIPLSNQEGRTVGAMGHAAGRSDFVLQPQPHTFNHDAYKPETVETTSLDTIIKSTTEVGHAHRVYKAFIWADVEGAELNIMQGAREALAAGKIAGFLLELGTNHQPGDTQRCGWKDVWDWCMQYGYRPVAIFNIQPTHFDCVFKPVAFEDSTAYLSSDFMYQLIETNANDSSSTPTITMATAAVYNTWVTKMMQGPLPETAEDK